MKIQAHYCPDSLDKLHAHIDGLSAIMRLYRPKKDDSHIISLIYGQHQKIRVVRESPFANHDVRDIKTV